MGKRLDYLKECNEHGVALQDFQEAFCKRCYQPECTRSLFGEMKFDQRVSTWFDRLFANPPQMDPNDPLAREISAQKFQMINPVALSQGASDWHDPRDLKATSVSVPVHVTPEPTLTPKSVVEPPKPVVVEPEVNETPNSHNLSKEVVLINTPTSRGIMLPGGSGTSPRPQRDQWDTPQGVRPGEKVVKAGARVQLGGVKNEGNKKDQGESK
jgi:hypothetical protein